MQPSIKRGQVNQKIRAIQEAQKKISLRIRAIQRQLKRIEHVPESQPWISFERVNSVEELRAKTKCVSLKAALKRDIQTLKSQLSELRNRSVSVKRQDARSSSNAFQADLKKTLEDAERRGELSEAELARMRAGAEGVLKKHIEVLNVAPNEKNMAAVLGGMEAPMTLGSDVEGGVGGEGLRALKRAAETIDKQNEKAFEHNPTSENFVKMIDFKQKATLAGGDVSLVPKNFKEANTFHIVASGDSLSGIAERYYGNKAHWIMIYFFNKKEIGNNVRQLRVGIKLKIP